MANNGFVPNFAGQQNPFGGQFNNGGQNNGGNFQNNGGNFQHNGGNFQNNGNQGNGFGNGGGRRRNRSNGGGGQQSFQGNGNQGGNGNSDGGASKRMASSIAQLNNSLGFVATAMANDIQERESAKQLAREQAAKEEAARIEREKDEKQAAALKVVTDSIAARDQKMDENLTRVLDAIVKVNKHTPASTPLNSGTRRHKMDDSAGSVSASSGMRQIDLDSILVSEAEESADEEDDTDWVNLANELEEQRKPSKRAKQEDPKVAPAKPAGKDPYCQQFLKKADHAFLALKVTPTLKTLALKQCAMKIPSADIPECPNMHDLLVCICKHKSSGTRSHWFGKFKAVTGKPATNGFTMPDILARIVMHMVKNKQ